MKNLIVPISVLLFSYNIYSQGHDDLNINPLWEFYSFNYLSTISAGKGFTGMASENDITGFNLNPASIEMHSKNQINFQYTYKSSQPWLRNSFFKYMNLRQQLYSGSLGYGRKINENLQIGFIYNNPTGMYFDFGEVIKTNQFGNEIGRYDNYYNISSHSFNIPFVYRIKNLKFGINLNYLLSRYSIPGEAVTTLSNPFGFSDGSLTATSHYFKVHAGVIFSVKDKFSIGAKVISGGKSDVKVVYPDGTDGDQIQTANYPWKAGAGIQFYFNKSFRLLLDYNYTNTSMQEGLKDRHDGHIGIEGIIDKSWTLRGGFFTLLDFRKDVSNLHWIDPPGDYDQYFITFGVGYSQKNFGANIAFLTSEISSGIIKNTYLNGGLTFNF